MKFGTALTAVIALLLIAAWAQILSVPWLISAAVLLALGAVFPPAAIVIASLVAFYIIVTRYQAMAMRFNRLTKGGS